MTSSQPESTGTIVPVPSGPWAPGQGLAKPTGSCSWSGSTCVCGLTAGQDQGRTAGRDQAWGPGPSE